MKPTQEQVIAWAREAGMSAPREIVVNNYWTADYDDLDRFATLAYEAGRKDENEACAEMVKNWKPEFFEHMTQEYAVHFIRQRREQ